MIVTPLFGDAPEYLIPAVSAGVGFAVGGLALGYLLARKRRADRPPLTPDAPPQRVEDWEAQDHSYANRRGSVRREGQPVKVVLSSPSFRNRVETAYVLDRSTGGLRLAAGLALAPGSTVQVRAANAPDSVQWVTVIIRNCRNAGQHFELGCEFDKTPPWNVLLLFG